MKYICAAIVIATFSSVCGAGEDAATWQAQVTESACYTDLTLEVDRSGMPMSPGAGFSWLWVRFAFIVLHADASNPYPDIPGIEPGMLFLASQVQRSRYWTEEVQTQSGMVATEFRKGYHDIATAKISDQDQTHTLLHSASADSENYSTYVLPDPAATEMWSRLVRGEEVTYELDFSDGSSSSIGVTGERLVSVSKKFDACISAKRPGALSGHPQ